MNTKISILVVAIFIVIVFIFLRLGDTSESADTEITNSQDSMDTQNMPSGLQTEIITQGTGAQAQTGDTVVVHYAGTLTDGQKFDSSIDRGAPFSFTLGEGRVISGWELGVTGMKIGEKRKLTIPAELGYGVQGVPGVIPGGATLVFEVELLEIK